MRGELVCLLLQEVMGGGGRDDGRRGIVLLLEEHPGHLQVELCGDEIALAMTERTALSKQRERVVGPPLLHGSNRSRPKLLCPLPPWHRCRPRWMVPIGVGP